MLLKTKSRFILVADSDLHWDFCLPGDHTWGMGLCILNNRQRLYIKKARASVNMVLFILERHRTSKRDLLLAAKDFPEDGCHCDDLGVVVKIL